MLCVWKEGEGKEKEDELMWILGLVLRLDGHLICGRESRLLFRIILKIVNMHINIQY